MHGIEFFFKYACKVITIWYLGTWYWLVKVGSLKVWFKGMSKVDWTHLLHCFSCTPLFRMVQETGRQCTKAFLPSRSSWTQLSFHQWRKTPIPCWWLLMWHHQLWSHHIVRPLLMMHFQIWSSFQRLVTCALSLKVIFKPTAHCHASKILL